MTIARYFQQSPMIVFPIPIVRIDVNVEAGVTKLDGINAAFPITIWMACTVTQMPGAIPKDDCC